MSGYDFDARSLRAKQDIDDALGQRVQQPVTQMPQAMPQMQRPVQANPQMQQLMARYQPGTPATAPARQAFSEGGGVWTRKEGQNPEGGLNAAGRASLRAQGHDIKPPVSAKQAAKSPKAAGRRKSFCARMGGMEGPMKDENGKPTRKALALRKWDC